jgi:hypothetical protein
MKWLCVVLLIIWAAWLTDSRIDSQTHRVVQLECALAQAHATIDTLEVWCDDLEAAIESCKPCDR